VRRGADEAQPRYLGQFRRTVPDQLMLIGFFYLDLPGI
jgi:hypothetical protein